MVLRVGFEFYANSSSRADTPLHPAWSEVRGETPAYKLSRLIPAGAATRPDNGGALQKVPRYIWIVLKNIPEQVASQRVLVVSLSDGCFPAGAIESIQFLAVAQELLAFAFQVGGKAGIGPQPIPAVHEQFFKVSPVDVATIDRNQQIVAQVAFPDALATEGNCSRLRESDRLSTGIAYLATALGTAKKPADLINSEQLRLKNRVE